MTSEQDALPSVRRPAPWIPPRLRKPWASAVPPILLEWFQDRRAEGFAKNTCISYALDLKDLAGFLTVSLEDATAADLRAYQRSLLVRNLAVQTRGRRITAVRQFYDWFRKRQGQQFSIAQDLRPGRRPDDVHRWWTTKEVAQFRKAFSGDDPTTLRDRALVELGLMGLRVSEVVGLDVNTILNLNSPARASIIVRRKGNKEQVLPLNRDARQALMRWLQVRHPISEPAVFFRIPFQPSRPRLGRAWADKMVHHYAAVAGLKMRPQQAFHHLRHTAGQRMSDVGVTIEEAQTMLGHRDPKTTMVYYRVNDKRLRKTARRLRYDRKGETAS